MQENNLNIISRDIISSLKKSGLALLTAEPGVGKTVKIPLLLSQQLNRKVIVIEPRAVAAINSAQYVAQTNHLVLGKDIGYRTGAASKSGNKVMVEYITDGVAAKLLSDPNELDEVGLIIFDEFHERTIWNDYTFAQVMAEARDYRDLLDELPPFAVLVMSATLDLLTLTDTYPFAEHHHIHGRRFPLEIHYQPTRRDDINQIANVIKRAFDETTQSVLVFTPGRGMIRALERNLAGLPVYPLHGGLSINRQYETVNMSTKRIVLATNLAESSLTVNNIDTVIDTGLVHQQHFDFNRHQSLLRRVSISKASATQRGGRAGRTSAGTVIRLWSKEEQASLYDQSLLPIYREPIDSLLLQAFSKTDSLENLPFLDVPNSQHVSYFKQSLTQQGLMSDSKVTEKGLAANKLPLAPSLAGLLISANYDQQLTLLSLLIEHAAPKVTSTLDELVAQYQKGQLAGADRVRRYLKFLSNKLTRDDRINAYDVIALHFGGSLARYRGGDGYYLASGERLNINDFKGDWLIALQVTSLSKGVYAKIILPVSDTLADAIIRQRGKAKRSVEQSKKGLFINEAFSFGQFGIPVNRVRATGAVLRATAAAQLVDNDYGLFKSQQIESLMPCLNRLLFAELLPFDPAQPEHWQQLFDDYQVNTLDDLQKLNLAQLLYSQLDWAEQQSLDVKAPKTVAIKIGKVNVDYRTSDQQVLPTVSEKLQVLLGTDQQIYINKVAVRFELLSPAGRPVQVTNDLASFWRGSYQETRKELKSRYPRHDWPEDALNATPSYATSKRARGV